MNLGQVVVLAPATAVLNVCLTAGATPLSGYTAAFPLLAAPPLLVALLATRARAD